MGTARNRSRAEQSEARRKGRAGALVGVVAGAALILGGAIRTAPGVGPFLFGEYSRGTVVDVVDSSVDRSLLADTYVATIEFRAAGGRLVRIARVMSSEDSTLHRGGDVGVVYFARDPEGAQVKDYRAEWVGGAPLVLFGGALIAASVAAGREAIGRRASSGSRN